MAEPTLAPLYTQRACTGHPEAVHREGRRLFFDETQMRVWAAARIEAKRAGLTAVDRGGDPDELVDVDEAARVLGYANRRTIDSYLARRSRGYFPEPDDPTGRRWRRRTPMGVRGPPFTARPRRTRQLTGGGARRAAVGNRPADHQEHSVASSDTGRGDRPRASVELSMPCRPVTTGRCTLHR